MRREKGLPFVRAVFPVWMAVYALAAAGQVLAAANEFDKTLLHPAIPVLDEDGRHVLQSGKPYSTKMSCGNGSGSGCHDYDRMNHAYHFEQGRDETDDQFGKKHGLPQLVSPGYFGGYNCMQGSTPGALARKTNTSAAEFGDWGAAGFLKACGSCHSGGGWAEKDRNGVRYDQMPDDGIADRDGDYFERDGSGGLVRWDWKKSGVREADCLTCHADFTLLKKFPASRLGASDGSDGSDTAYNHWGWLQDQKFVQSGLFRYANTALLEFLNVHPELPDGASLLSVERQVAAGSAKPDYQLTLGADGLPILHWNQLAFDTSGKIQIPMRRFPASDNCMVCHLAGEGINRVAPVAAGSRRGFYGFGEDARERFDAGGALIPDYRTDVHKGVVWNDDSGESRIIDNCSACHAKKYYEPLYVNVALDADHDFPKGNGDSDIRNDLDEQPGPLACEYCHNTAKNPALTSGHRNILEAHVERWKARGDMLGYAAGTLNKITTTHLDEIGCQTCHVSNVQYKGSPIQLRYRYRIGADGSMKVIPYKPASRFYARDKISGRMLYRYERESVFAKRTGSDGTAYGAIIDPANGQEVGQVPVDSAGEFGMPASYDEYKALKRAYDNLLKSKGYKNPDVSFVYVESNEYIVTHQTRPAVQAVQCTDCHVRKQDGSINSLVSTTGLFGAGNVAEVAMLPDRRLVDEGIVELGMPYYQVDTSGRITENASDVLYASKIDPSMSILKAESTRSITGEFRALDAGTATTYAGVDGTVGAKMMQALNSGEWLLFNSRVGHASLRGVAVVLAGNESNRGLFSGARAEVDSREAKAGDRRRIRASGLGKLVSDVYSMGLKDAARKTMRTFAGSSALVKLPYQGDATRPKQVRVLYSNNGKSWHRIPVRNVVAFQPNGDGSAGYAIVRTRRPYPNLAIADKPGL